jgi:hypothetical protein
MDSLIDSIFRPEELAAARGKVYSEELTTLRSASRRSNDPAERVALAELERTLAVRLEQLRQEGQAA